MKSAGFHRNQRISPKSRGFRASDGFAVKGASEHQYFLRNIDGLAPGAREAPFSPENRENMRIPQKSLKSREIIKITKIHKNHKMRKARLGAGRAPGPAPPGPPFEYEMVRATGLVYEANQWFLAFS